MKEELSLEELQDLALFVKERFNYDFRDYAMSSFRRRITRILELYKLKSVDQLKTLLTRQEQFAEEFVSEITVNVTEMFRDPTFWQSLRNDVLPNLFLSKDHISIWHAGCSSGEEVYSMAIMLEEMGALNKAKIVATDMDRAIIKRAQRGAYSLKNMEVNQKNYERVGGKYNLKDYYREANGEALMRDDLVNNVSFRRHDLVVGETFSKFDIVLCRNVMIYFNQQLQNTVLHKLHDSLHRYGYLIIGSKESLIWCDIAYKFIVVNN
ncbi:MAG: protein-glutamate O-methyltransferase CheR, partial [Bacteroidota bacterium]